MLAISVVFSLYEVLYSLWRWLEHMGRYAEVFCKYHLAYINDLNILGFGSPHKALCRPLDHCSHTVSEASVRYIHRYFVHEKSDFPLSAVRIEIRKG